MGFAMVALGAYFLIKELAEDDTSLGVFDDNINMNNRQLSKWSFMSLM